MQGAALIDEQRNIYTAAMDGMRKLSPDGTVRWFYPTPRGYTQSVPSLMDGVLYGSTIDGWVFAVSMETGEELWLQQHSTNSEMDSPYVETNDGMVFAVFDREKTPTCWLAGNTRVVAMRAADGEMLWEYKSDEVLWNFHPQFVGDGTFIFMDVHGGAYRMAMSNGTLLWHTPAPTEFRTSFSDGGVILGPGGAVAYTCSSDKDSMPGSKGALRAYAVDDGRQLWQKELPQACVSWPAVTSDNRTVAVPVGPLPLPVPPVSIIAAVTCFVFHMSLWLHLAVCLCDCATRRRCAKVRSCCCYANVILLVLVLGMLPWHWLSIWLGDSQIAYMWGLFGFQTRPLEVLAFDAQTGALRWRFDDIPHWGKVSARNDEDNMVGHFLRKQWYRPVCGPASWSAPTFDGRGTFYAGAMNGILYAIRDANGDGIIDTDSEVSSLDIDAASLHGGPSFAPGMMAYASCQRLHVFHT